MENLQVYIFTSVVAILLSSKGDKPSVTLTGAVLEISLSSF